MSAENYSSENLDRFLVMASGKGLMNKNTAQAIRIAAGKVLGILEDHERIDVRALDRERVFKRFQNLNGMNYSPESLNTYRSRFNTALDEFIAYTSDPSGYKAPSGKNGSQSKRAMKKPAVRATNIGSTPTHPDTQASSAQVHSTNPESLMIPIPIRDGILVKIFGIPTNLTEDEAKKISAVVQAYAVVH